MLSRPHLFLKLWKLYVNNIYIYIYILYIDEVDNIYHSIIKLFKEKNEHLLDAGSSQKISKAVVYVLRVSRVVYIHIYIIYIYIYIYIYVCCIYHIIYKKIKDQKSPLPSSIPHPTE